MPLWDKDYFELKGTEKKQIKKGSLPTSNLPKNRTYIYKGVPPPLSTTDRI